MKASEVSELFRFLVEDVHSTVMATVDGDGLPRTAVIDLVLYDDDALYFLTARGKRFYDEVTACGSIALTGKKGEDTMSTVAVSIRGKLRDIGTGRITEIFEKNPHLDKIYRTKESRRAATVFQIYEGEGELFDLRVMPPRREVFAFGGGIVRDEIYRITDACISCGKCTSICPSDCIGGTDAHLVIDTGHCIRCGSCLDVCPCSAVEHIK